MKIRTKWVLLQLLSMLSFVTLFPALFSAVPLVLLRLETPRNYFYLFVATANILMASYFLVVNPPGVALIGIYLAVCFWGALGGELLLKYFDQRSDEITDPSKFWSYYLGLGTIPLLIFICCTPLFLGHPEQWFSHLKIWVEQHVLNSPSAMEILKELKKNTSAEADQAVKLIENSDLFTKQLIFLIPSYLIVAYYVLAYFTIFFTSRLGHLTGLTLKPKWADSIVLGYRNPDWSIISVILVLAWYLFSDMLPLSPFWKENGMLLGSSLINVIGVFFFFQGFVVTVQFFDHWGIKGIVRTIVLFLIFVLALRAVVLLGLIDMWFDFRKKYVKRNSKTLL